MTDSIRIFVQFCFSFVILISLSATSFASDAPADGQGFFNWVWDDQFKPMLHESTNKKSLQVLAGGVVATALSFQYDRDIHQRQISDDRIVPKGTSTFGAVLGSGFPGVSIALAQIYWDRSNGLMHGRAIALTSATHFSMALLAQRERPNKHNRLSFPSGHTSSSFATAASLGYAYGPWVGVPAYLLAAFVGASRISDDAHWFSDTVGGAALGIYWASVSAQVKANSNVTFIPVVSSQGAQAIFRYDF